MVGLPVGATYTAVVENRQILIYDGFTPWASRWRNWEQPFVEWAERVG